MPTSGLCPYAATVRLQTPLKEFEWSSSGIASPNQAPWHLAETTSRTKSPGRSKGWFCTSERALRVSDRIVSSSKWALSTFNLVRTPRYGPSSGHVTHTPFGSLQSLSSIAWGTQRHLSYSWCLRFSGVGCISPHNFSLIKPKSYHVKLS